MIKYVFYIIVISISFITKGYANEPEWSVDVSKYAYSMTFTGQINITGDLSENVNDMIGAFVGDECRGVAKNILDNEYNTYYCYLMVYSNSANEEITFKIYDSENGKIIPVKNSHYFIINNIVGEDINPFYWASENLNSESKINAFTFNNQIGETRFSNNNIEIDISDDVDITKLKPNFDLSDGAIAYINDIKQISGESATDFSSQVSVKVLSQDMLNTETYYINVIPKKADKTTSVNSTEFEKMIISPNPATDFIEITGINSMVDISIYNNSGILLIRDSNINNNCRVDITQLSAGFYTVLLSNSKNSIAKKLIVK